ncbi:hypothetical protein [Microbacterium gilvum]|uniref:Uncharacterized protein n=1 Tax=Microbacterium gilvum TaxID=1336204 RepID=A0ABP8ZQE2_9MICO
MTVDGTGAVLSVTVSQSRFRPGDVELLLESRRAEREPRGSHGHPLTLATDPTTRGRWVVPAPTEDYAQTALNRAQKDYREKYPDFDMDSYLWSVELPDEQ